MNKTFTRLFAGALAAASLFALASCGEKKAGDDKGANASTPAPITEAPSVTDEPTTAPTEAPTPEPTETTEPTATPTPEGWYVDPRGIIPPEVEILVPDGNYGNTRWAWCISNMQGTPTLQLWMAGGKCAKTWIIPEELTQATEIFAETVKPSDESAIIVFGQKEDNWLIFYTDDLGHTLFFNAVSYFSPAEGIVFLTDQNAVIWYDWYEDYYRLYDFGKEKIRLQEDNFAIIVNEEEYFFIQDLNWMKVRF